MSVSEEFCKCDKQCTICPDIFTLYYAFRFNLFFFTKLAFSCPLKLLRIFQLYKLYKIEDGSQLYALSWIHSHEGSWFIYSIKMLFPLTYFFTFIRIQRHLRQYCTKHSGHTWFVQKVALFSTEIWVFTLMGLV